MPIENTDLERRVLAHELILQALIGHVANQQPEILERLRSTFGNGHDLGQHEHDFTSTAQYADHFMRMIEDVAARPFDPAPEPITDAQFRAI